MSPNRLEARREVLQPISDGVGDCHWRCRGFAAKVLERCSVVGGISMQAQRTDCSRTLVSSINCHSFCIEEIERGRMLSQPQSGLDGANRFGLRPGHAGAGLQSANQSAASGSEHVSDSGVAAD